MANHKSSIKRIRQTIVRTERNRFYRTRLKNIVKDVRSAIDAGKIKECNFVHFFLKDKLPNQGENVKAVIEELGIKK